MRIYLLVFVLFFSSCNIIMSTTMGIKNIKHVDEQQITQFVTKEKWSYDASYVLDTNYIEKLKEWCNNDTLKFKNLMQPLQAYYFYQDSLISLHINCFAGDTTKITINNYFNLNWNAYGRFDTFPAVSALQDISSWNYTLNHLEHFTGYKLKNESKSYTVVIFWNRMMPKLSKTLYKTVYNNIKLQEKDVHLVLINNDCNYLNIL